MKIFAIMLGFAGMTVLLSCSKTGESNKEAGSNKPLPSSSSKSDVPAQEKLSNEDALAIAHAKPLLSHPDIKMQVQGIRELKRTYTPEACRVLVDLLKKKEGKLPVTLGQDETPEIRYQLDYLGGLLEEIRKMNQPEGNEAVAAFMKNFGEKYGHEKLGQSQLAIYASQLKNAEIDIKRGIEGKKIERVEGLTN